MYNIKPIMSDSTNFVDNILMHNQNSCIHPLRISTPWAHSYTNSKYQRKKTKNLKKNYKKKKQQKNDKNKKKNK